MAITRRMKNHGLMRSAAIQSVTLNLPRLGYKAAGDEKKLFALLSEFIEKAVKAHVQKKDFLEKLLSYAEKGPLAVLAMNHDGFPFLRMNMAYYIIGIVGLNELVQIHQGKELHQSPEALEFGLKVVDYMKREAERLSEGTKIKFVLGAVTGGNHRVSFCEARFKIFFSRRRTLC